MVKELNNSQVLICPLVLLSSYLTSAISLHFVVQPWQEGFLPLVLKKMQFYTLYKSNIRAVLILYFLFQCDTDISALGINRYRYQSEISRRQMKHTFITSFVMQSFLKAAWSDITPTENDSRQQ